jgi:regulatory protein
MTDDERLAPVTSLFGRRSAGDAAGTAANNTRPGARPTAPGDESGEDQWPAAADAVAGADETGAGETGAGETRAEESDSHKGLPPRKPAAGKLTVLPTYAAFAAATEGSESTSTLAEVESEQDPEMSDPATPDPETLEAARDRAENVSMHALTRRGVSSVEMAKTLRSRDLPEEVVQAEVDRLERVGLLDDVALAENLVRTKQDRKGLGKSAISSELRQRGLAQEAIDGALAEIDDDAEQTRADEWAEKRAGQLRGLDHTTAERRLTAFLLRRGYRSEVARRAIEKALPRGGSSGGVRFR